MELLQALDSTPYGEDYAAGVLVRVFSDALIAIAVCFCPHPAGHVECWHCGENVEDGCDPQCPGPAARVALGVG